MKAGVVRILASPAIVPAYTCYGAIRGRLDGNGFLKGAMIGVLFGITYVITGERLNMEVQS